MARVPMVLEAAGRGPEEPEAESAFLNHLPIWLQREFLRHSSDDSRRCSRCRNARRDLIRS